MNNISSKRRGSMTNNRSTYIIRQSHHENTKATSYLAKFKIAESDLKHEVEISGYPAEFDVELFKRQRMVNVIRDTLSGYYKSREFKVGCCAILINVVTLAYLVIT